MDTREQAGIESYHSETYCNAPIFCPGSPKPNWPRHRQSAARATRLTLLLAAAPLSPSIASLACGATRWPSPMSTPSSPRHVPPTALSCPAPSPSSPFLLPRAELGRARAARVPPAKSLASAPSSSNHSHPKLPHLPSSLPSPLELSSDRCIAGNRGSSGHRPSMAIEPPPRRRTPSSGHRFLCPAAQIEAR